MCPLHLVEIKQPTDYESGILPWKYIPNALNKPTTTYQLTQAPHNYLTWVINLRNLKRKKKNKMGFIFEYKKRKKVLKVQQNLFQFSLYLISVFLHLFSKLLLPLLQHPLTITANTHMHTKVIKTVNCPKHWLHCNRHGRNCPKHSECLATGMDGIVQSTVSA